MRTKLDLAAAMAAPQDLAAVDMTLAELILGFNTATVGDYDWRLRKWIEAFGSTSAWAITSEQLESAARAMLAHGYKPSTVNRDLSALGSCYRWAKTKRLSPRVSVAPRWAFSASRRPSAASRSPPGRSRP